MFLYTTAQKFQFKLNYFKLSEKPDMLNQAAEWGESEWGYLRGFPGIEKRKELIQAMKNEFYIVMYGEQPVGMFALLDRGPVDKNILKIDPTVKLKKLTYFYVHAGLRGLGVGTAMLEKAKNIAASQSATMIVLDTLKPNLNRFYEKSGARTLCEDKSLGAPTTLLRI